MVNDLPGDVGPRISAISSSQLTLEQYRDFVTNRMFRKTLVCHKEVEIDREISAADLGALEYRKRIASDEDGNWLIKKVGGSVVQVSDASVGSVLRAISDACPRALPFQDLQREASALLGADIPAEKLAGILLSLLALDAVEPRTWTPTVALEVGEYPEVFLPARRQPADRRDVLPLPQHGFAKPSPFIAAMLDLVDGTRTPTQIVDAVADEVRRGVFLVDGAPPEGEPSREALESLVFDGLQELKGIGLLVAK
jgi:methyltransferase-like protein